jgi:hypothetical protein
MAWINERTWLHCHLRARRAGPALGHVRRTDLIARESRSVYSIASLAQDEEVQ